MTLLSLQQVDPSKRRHNSRSTYFFKRAARSAAINSSRDRLSRLARATCALPRTNLTSFTSPRDSPSQDCRGCGARLPAV
ncbi:hypothetical protein T4B_10543 [Trichinella pseudospiralis]|uniref:Uncharacterized protein n=2 Tax=Trichinella pseudospiralis TaxID=6337 RepID=A0A0V1FRQ7_TRIPS|nr:hypothetical protein T4E_4766 [Trichinella pseudospiralis]KRY88638.1 hypothetical protein T4D_15016 [Trichinella pseudospiralis]KRZ21015.1 hypothetical protein T4B_10543 [Trichinella pseudospiralis]KRZ41642.1 hypothetical protein T4C_2024 [Trichinella pseudospiralis]